MIAFCLAQFANNSLYDFRDFLQKNFHNTKIFQNAMQSLNYSFFHLMQGSD